MKKLLAVLALALTLSVPSFGAEHFITRSAKVAGKDCYKTAKYSATKADEAGRAVMRFLF